MVYNKLLGDVEEFLTKNKRLVYFTYERFKRQLNSLHIDKEDAIQEGWITLYDVYRVYNGSAKVSTLAIMAISNKYKKMVRDTKAQKRMVNYRCVSMESSFSFDEKLKIRDHVAQTDDVAVIPIDTKDMIERWIGQLSPQDRHIVNLRLQDKIQHEIAQKVGLSQSKVSKHLKQAKRKYDELVSIG